MILSINNFNEIIKGKIKKKQNDNPQFNAFSESILNPSLSKSYVKKKFPDLFNKYKIIGAKNQLIELERERKKIDIGFLTIKKTNETYNDRYSLIKNEKKANISKEKLKWKAIKWLIENKKESIDKLIKSSERLLYLTNVKFKKLKRGINRKEFCDLMINNGITNEIDLLYKLFWLFDENGSGKIEYNEIVFGLEMFRESPVQQKIKAFFNLCDIDGNGKVTKTELYNSMKKNIMFSKERILLKQVVDKIFQTSNNDKNEEITLEELQIGCEKNKMIYDIIEKNLSHFKSIDTIIDNDVKKDLLKIKIAENKKKFDIKQITTNNPKKKHREINEKKFEEIINDLVENKLYIKNIYEDLGNKFDITENVYDEDNPYLTI